MLDSWMARKAKKIQGYADGKEWKNFFSAIWAVYSPTAKGIAPPVGADGNTRLTEKKKIMKGWARHFRGVLNRSSTISDVAIACLPQTGTNDDLNVPPSTLNHQDRATALQRKGPGLDAIPVEIYKHGDPQLMDYMMALFQQIWR
nr:unnamed protein product [Spirometra erinaceieuropaei]